MLPVLMDSRALPRIAPAGESSISRLPTAPWKAAPLGAAESDCRLAGLPTLLVSLIFLVLGERRECVHGR
jgi:hypothetical protein